MNTDDLRTKYGKVIHFNCKDGDEAFTDGYVLWLEKQLLLYDVVFNEACEVDLDMVVKFPSKHTTTYTLKKKESEVELCRNFQPDTYTTSATKCVFCGKESWEH